MQIKSVVFHIHKLTCSLHIFTKAITPLMSTQTQTHAAIPRATYCVLLELELFFYQHSLEYQICSSSSNIILKGLCHGDHLEFWSKLSLNYALINSKLQHPPSRLGNPRAYLNF